MLVLAIEFSRSWASTPPWSGARRELEDDCTLPVDPVGDLGGRAFPQNGTEEDRPTSS
jgi:hypothetical protein